MWQKKQHFHCQKRVLPCILTLLGLLLPGFLAGCGNSGPSSATPPQPGSVLYALYLRWEKPIGSWKDLTTTAATLTVEAMHTSNGQSVWQTPMLTGILDLSMQNTTIVSAGSMIFVTVSKVQEGGQKGQVIALDAHDGQVLWKSTLDGARILQSVAANGALYLKVDERVEALDGSSGKHLWSAPTDANYHIGALVPTDKALYVEQEGNSLSASQGGTYDSAFVRALQLSDGTEIWRREVANTNTDQLSSLTHVSIQADEQAIYVLRDGDVMESHGNVGESFPRYTLFALNAQNGSPLWSSPTRRSEEAGRQFSLTLFKQVLYVVGIANPGINTLSAFQSRDGKQLWTWQTAFLLSPFAPPNHVYGSSLNPGESFCALRANNGGKAWCAGYEQVGPALFSGGKVYLYAIPATSPGSSSQNQSSQIYVLNEGDGSLAAHYWSADPRRIRLEDMVLS